NTQTASDPAGMVSTDLMISSSAANLLTVRASIAGNPNIWTAFTITVTDALATGLTADSFYNGASLQRGRIAPCGLTTIIAPGLAPAIQGLVSADGSGPLPYTLANDSVSFNNIPAPLLSASNVSGQQQLTVQAPCEL